MALKLVMISSAGGMLNECSPNADVGWYLLSVIDRFVSFLVFNFLHVNFNTSFQVPLVAMNNTGNVSHQQER
jgi:hypothetical protein